MLKSDIMDSGMFRNYLEEKVQLMPSSIYIYTTYVNAFLNTDPDLEDIDSYNKYLVEKVVRHRSDRTQTALKHFINFKIKDKGLRDQLLDGLIVPKIRHDRLRERKYLNEMLLNEVINHIKLEKHRVIATIQCLTGVRAGDILRIRDDGIVPEIYNDKLVLKLSIVGKGRKRNVVYIHDKGIIKYILNFVTNYYKARDGYVFMDEPPRGHQAATIVTDFVYEKVNYKYYLDDLRNSLEEVGINKDDFATHDYRRCFARRFWMLHKDVQALQKLLNHTDARATFKYLEQSGLQNIDYHKEMQS